MKLVIPETITLVSSNVAASSETAYNAGTTYAKDDMCKDTATVVHEYKSLADSNLGNALTDTTKWQDQGASNKWAMFDDKVSSTTSNATTIDVVFTATKPDFLSLFNLSGTTVQVIFMDANDGDAVISDTTYNLLDGSSASWSDYFFKEAEYKTDLAVDVPQYLSIKTQVIITATTALCGHVSIGRSIELGQTKAEPTVGILDFSRKLTDDFGETYLSTGSFAKKASVDLWFDSGSVDSVMSALAGVRATPCTWQLNNTGHGDLGHDALLIFGFVREFSIVIPGPKLSFCSLEIEGLT